MTNNLLPSQIANQQQQRASNPLVSAWVSASAGSGKTKVLTDRILNILLTGVEPEKILCLTFTKTAAAEMSNRLSETLQQWAVEDDDKLRQKIFDLAPDLFDEEKITLARKLFAKVLDVKGGMKITTIHSFCQSLLKRFPVEAGLSPSFSVVDEKEAKTMMAQSVKNIIIQDLYKQEIADVADYVNENGFIEMMKTFINESQKLKKLLDTHSSMDSIIDRLYRLFALNTTDTPERIIQRVCRLEEWDNVREVYLRKDGQPRDNKKKAEPEKTMAVYDVFDKLRALKMVKQTSAFLRIGFAILDDYEQSKKQQAVLDYNDLILTALRLLESSDMSSWVLYKLDGGIDHILVDEAQDTNPEQWEIVRDLADEFFAGEDGNENLRSIFVVGDKKQSIFSFQGANPDEFDRMKNYFSEKVSNSQNSFEDVSINISFRSTKPVLDLVNLLLKNDYARLGVLSEDEEAVHLAHRFEDAGLVELWPLITPEDDEKDGSENILDIRDENKKPPVLLAEQIADRISKMLKNKEILESQNRPIQAGDIMILVRRRNAFVNNLVRALKERKVPIAGIDRLILNNHIAVQDLISLGEFLLLPDDDLKLAEILKSPIFNVSEEELFDLCYNRKGTLFASVAAKNQTLYNKIKLLLSLTETLRPFELFEYVLTQMHVREQFIRRLGTETEEALDEFLNLCLLFEENNIPSLQNFIRWLKQDDIEIKRDLDQSNLNAVRIMTVHASKGLQANIVFLPDTTSAPNKTSKIIWVNGLPICLPNKEDQCDISQPFINAELNKEKREYHRLLYVALTRAKDRLYICGALGKKGKLEGTWYDLISKVMPPQNIISSTQTKEVKEIKKDEKKVLSVSEIPDFWNKEPVKETPLSKPLTPSKPESQEVAENSPITENQKKAMMRGTFIHQALQILPQTPVNERLDVLNAIKPADIDIPSNLLSLIERDDFSLLFSQQSKAEVPIVGEVDGKIISGQVDRLVITDDAIMTVDFKTNRKVPTSPMEVPSIYKEQLFLYKCLLKKLFNDKMIKTYLLWTENQTLMEIDV